MINFAHRTHFFKVSDGERLTVSDKRGQADQFSLVHEAESNCFFSF